MKDSFLFLKYAWTNDNTLMTLVAFYYLAWKNKNILLDI